MTLSASTSHMASIDEGQQGGKFCRVQDTVTETVIVTTRSLIDIWNVWVSRLGPWTSSISINQELVRGANSPGSPRRAEQKL